jgi:aryl sulfotransferase
VSLPQVEHIYQNHHLDSTRWQHFAPRPDDIIIATPYKSGTTWMQMIVQHLVFGDLEIRQVHDISPWLDNRSHPIEEVLQKIEKQTHRRFIKSHLPLDGLIFYPEVKYIVVARDARDVFMSLWNHYSHYSADMFARTNDFPGRVGPPFPRCPDDIREFWQMWITQGWFPWESEGYPYWSNLRHVQTWWNAGDLPNILLVHFSDLLADLEHEIRRIADYLEIKLPDALLAEIAQAVTFTNVKQKAQQILPNSSFIGGAQTFIYKGTNGRWRNVLSDDDLELYEAAAARELSPACAQWLERAPQ